jgi:hypothetical protein
MKYALVKNIKSIKNSVAPTAIYAFLIVSDLSNEIPIKTGKTTSKYLGSPEKVPLKTGIKKANNPYIR